jgi:hypothetical protein
VTALVAAQQRLALEAIAATRIAAISDSRHKNYPQQAIAAINYIRNKRLP